MKLKFFSRFCVGFFLLVLEEVSFCTDHAKIESFLGVFFDSVPLWPLHNFPWKDSKITEGKELCLGAQGTFNTLEFWQERNVCAQGIVELLHGRLFLPSEQEPGIAYSYVARHVQRYKDRVVFWIDSDAKFHNGAAVLPEDVVFSFYFLTKNSSIFKSYFSGISKAELVSYPLIQSGKKLSGVVFYLEKNAPQEAALTISEMVVLPKSVYQHGVPKIPVGCGPYKVEAHQEGEFVRFQKVPQWWGANRSCGKDMYRFSTIKYIYFKEDDSMFEAFKKGELHCFFERSAKRWMNGYNFNEVTQGIVKKQEVFYKDSVPITGLLFNTRKPIFQDIRVRWALSLLLDFDTLNQKFFYKKYKRICSFFQNTSCMAKGSASFEVKRILKSFNAPEETWTQPAEYFTQLPGTWHQRSKAALSFLKEGGWKLRNGKLFHETLGFLQVKVCIPKSMRDEWLQFFQARAALIGVELNIISLDQAAYQSVKSSFDYDMIWGMMGISSSFPGQELELIYSSHSADKAGSYNMAGISDINIDALIQQVKSAKNQKELQFLAQALDRYLLSGCYGIFGWYCPNTWQAFWKNRIVYPRSSPFSPQRRWIYAGGSKNP
ncbi:putative binding protein/BS1330_II0571 [Holospora elegans E1]|uniref:Putative binding protein/BS1330_II0571 n=1 Tax=Holospora elegans E1 TaxID=1427503 RepID=A0A023DZE3_9PROT|nr:ABC transporter substrate-binding protein [Holospora elegans]GAJ46428.1 putative binding protein/BS1330_II0571 [Holospora elegans E1]